MTNSNGYQIKKYEGNDVTFELTGTGVMVNATEMAKPYGNSKSPKFFLANQSTKDFIDTLSEVRNLTSGDLYKVRKGNFTNSKQGTFMHEDLALEFARWLNPRFAIWTNDMIKELINNGKVEITGGTNPVKIKIVNGCKVSVIVLEEEWYRLIDVFKIFDYRTSNTTNLLPRIPEHTSRRLKTHMRGNTTEWYVNREGIVNFMFSSQKDIPISAINAVQTQLFGEELKQLPSSDQLRYAFMFTSGHILQIIAKVSGKRKDPVMVTEVIDLLMEGKRHE